MGMSEFENDPRFNSIEGRAENAKELIGTMDAKFASKPREEWLQILSKEGCICTPIQSPLEVSSDEQAIANDYFIYVDHPVWGRIKMVGFPWDFSGTPASWRREAPEFGQHTEEILLELGYTWEDITQLKDEEVTI
jgi:crotonobetainyl-CoA:carnitine CoA-transferase CaiB-like acyl-CoA transferase